MSRKTRQNVGGALAFVTGLAAGAAALFLSKKENRELVKREAVKAGRKAKKVAGEIKKNPKKFVKKTEAKVGLAVKKAVKSAQTKVKKAVAKTRRK